MKPIEVFNQIEQAVTTMQKLPPVAVKNKFCNWPDVIRSFWECYGTETAILRSRTFSRPTARQLKEMDEAIIWLGWIEPAVSKIIWARAEGASWRDIAVLSGISDKTAKAYAMAGVVEIAGRLNRPHKKERKLIFKRKMGFV